MNTMQHLAAKKSCIFSQEEVETKPELKQEEILEFNALKRPQENSKDAERLRTHL